jgi:hypothetical protein
MEASVAALTEAGIIQPWPITIKTEQGEQPFGGLHRIDEAALNALPDEAFAKLRKGSSLPIADAQLLTRERWFSTLGFWLDFREGM